MGVEPAAGGIPTWLSDVSGKHPQTCQGFQALLREQISSVVSCLNCSGITGFDLFPFVEE